MKLKSYNILFRIFSFLSDRTNGASFFVKYKLLLGTLIIGMAAPSKAQERVNKQDTLCYKQIANEKVVLKSDTLIEVSGKVIDEEGYSLINVSVLIKNTPYGTITDIDGNFTIDTDIDDIIEFSYSGYYTQEVIVEKIADGKVSIILKSGAIMCYEVVGVYYKNIKKEKTANIKSKKEKPTIKKNRKK